MSLELRQTQEQQVSPLMLQSLNVLQLSGADLEQWIAQEVQKNPFIECTRLSFLGNSDEAADFLLNVADRPSFFSLIDKQLADVDESVRDEVELLIENLDENGYLTPEILVSLGFKKVVPVGECTPQGNKSLENQAIPRYRTDNETRQSAYEYLSQLSPRGLGAVDVRDCLQLHLDPSLPLYRLIDENYDDIVHHRFSKLMRIYRCSKEMLRQWLAPLQRLYTSPRGLFHEADETDIRPDIIFTKHQSVWQFSIVSIPDVQMSETYKAAVAQPLKRGEKTFFNHYKDRAQWIMRALALRQQTLQKIAEYVLHYQADFLNLGKTYLHPQSMKQVAELIQLSPSTLSRAANKKYIQVGDQVFPLKILFSHGNRGSLYSIDAIYDAIRGMIKQEASLSDEKIAKRLQEMGYWVSRRTVTKYRQQMQIPPSNVRKLFPVK